MSNRIYEFSCAEGHTTCEYLDEGVRVITCDQCGKDSTRITSMGNFNLDRTFKTGEVKWLRQHESRGSK